MKERIINMSKREIHARIKTIDGNNEVVKFTYVGLLPEQNGSVPGSNYHYGAPVMCELVPYQKTRDSAIVSKYDFYIVPVYNKENQYVGRSCLCVDHVMAKSINARVFQTMIELARKYDDFNLFLKDAFASTVWNEEDVSPKGKAEWLKNVYIAAHRSMRDIVKETGLSQAKFGDYFGIPKRSIENWCNGATTPLPYILIMMQEILGLVNRE